VPEFRLSTVEGLHVPFIPSVDVVGNVGTAPPEQTERLVPKLNVGVMFELTVTTNDVVVAHCPPVGVKVYVPEFWVLTTAGFHVPFIPFVDVVGNAGTTPPAQIDKLPPKLKVGVILGLTVTSNVVLVAHCPAVGLNV
jgi:hypothetical protein